jgi:hypothetical protein
MHSVTLVRALVPTRWFEIVSAVTSFLTATLALPSSSKVEMTATWFLFVVAGYAQWFILLPSFLERRKRGTEPQ